MGVLDTGYSRSHTGVRPWVSKIPHLKKVTIMTLANWIGKRCFGGGAFSRRNGYHKRRSRRLGYEQLECRRLLCNSLPTISDFSVTNVLEPDSIVMAAKTTPAQGTTTSTFTFQIFGPQPHAHRCPGDIRSSNGPLVGELCHRRSQFGKKCFIPKGRRQGVRHRQERRERHQRRAECVCGHPGYYGYACQRSAPTDCLDWFIRRRGV